MDSEKLNKFIRNLIKNDDEFTLDKDLHKWAYWQNEIYNRKTH